VIINIIYFSIIYTNNVICKLYYIIYNFITMNKESKKTLTTAAVGAAIGASFGYAIGSSSPCDDCTCDLAVKSKSGSCLDKIRKQKLEYIAHKESNKCYTDPCETCPHK